MILSQWRRSDDASNEDNRKRDIGDRLENGKQKGHDGRRERRSSPPPMSSKVDIFSAELSTADSFESVQEKQQIFGL